MDNQTITILGKPYAIEVCEERHMDGLLGSASHAHGIIRISTNQSPDMMDETLLHEIIHMVDNELKLGFDEPTVCRLAVGLYSAGVKCFIKGLVT